MHGAQAAAAGDCGKLAILQHVQHPNLFLKHSDKTLATHVQNS
jgi:hypothetical protein